MPTEQTVKVGDITMAYDERGPKDGDPLLLIMGLGTQMTAWRDGFCDLLAARGFRVIRFDNRDVGHSTYFDGAPTPTNLQLMTRRIKDPAYTLADMSNDAAGLLDALDIPQAHVVGASMGGMIAQQMSIDHPQKVKTLTSIMSTTGNPLVGQSTLKAMATLLKPMPKDPDKLLDRMVAGNKLLASDHFPFDEPAVRERIGASMLRGSNPAGFQRQLAAIIAGGDRTSKLKQLDVPTLVIHGGADPLVKPSGGRATARAIPGARSLVIEGMGHDLPEQVWPQIVEAIDTLAQDANPR